MPLKTKLRLSVSDDGLSRRSLLKGSFCSWRLRSQRWVSGMVTSSSTGGGRLGQSDVQDATWSLRVAEPS
jgi:hypothetical protein